MIKLQCAIRYGYLKYGGFIPDAAIYMTFPKKLSWAQKRKLLDYIHDPERKAKNWFYGYKFYDEFCIEAEPNPDEYGAPPVGYIYQMYIIDEGFKYLDSELFEEFKAGIPLKNATWNYPDDDY